MSNVEKIITVLWYKLRTVQGGPFDQFDLFFSLINRLEILLIFKTWCFKGLITISLLKTFFFFNLMIYMMIFIVVNIYKLFIGNYIQKINHHLLLQLVFIFCTYVLQKLIFCDQRKNVYHVHTFLYAFYGPNCARGKWKDVCACAMAVHHIYVPQMC